VQKAIRDLSAQRGTKINQGRFVMVCRHCHQGKINRPRGLCWSCYYRPGVRESYPSTSKFARRGPGNFFAAAPMPARPTDALPGSPEKLAVLEERARLNQSLWHPDDARFENGVAVGAQRKRAG
jgi:hypothetical protein